MPGSCRDAAPSRARGATIAAILLVLAGAGLLFACGATAPREPAVTMPKRARWAAFEEALGLPSSGPAAPSRGHGVDPFLVEVRVSPASLDAYRRLTDRTVMPAGTTVLALHSRPNGTRASVFAMTKGAEGWEYVVAEADGTLTAQGALAQCEACHRSAPADHLFGLRPPAPAAGN